MQKVPPGLIVYRPGNIKSKKIKNPFDRFMSFTPIAILPQEKPATKVKDEENGNCFGLQSLTKKCREFFLN
jgi:hypothetical protein